MDEGACTLTGAGVGTGVRVGVAAFEAAIVFGTWMIRGPPTVAAVVVAVMGRATAEATVVAETIVVTVEMPVD